VLPADTVRPDNAAQTPELRTPDWSFHHHNGFVALGTPLPTPAAEYAGDPTPQGAEGVKGDRIPRVPGVGGVGAAGCTERFGMLARDSTVDWACVRIIGMLDLTLQATGATSVETSESCRAGVGGR